MNFALEMCVHVSVYVPLIDSLSIRRRAPRMWVPRSADSKWILNIIGQRNKVYIVIHFRLSSYSEVKETLAAAVAAEIVRIDRGKSLLPQGTFC